MDSLAFSSIKNIYYFLDKYYVLVVTLSLTG